ncbi:MAG TPA: site-2 protease family protein [Vicinamibacterales bacterium]|jgi:regulator of sigma E protease|nr:site-2 protease family protein [Vicinamibacterales bacterium]
MLTLLSFLFVLGVLVFVHELGHFLVARWHGVRVITFSLGFGPKLVKFTRGDTEYCVSAVPLGGYVKLAGETVEETRTGAPDEFLSKSKWVRFQVYVAGPVMNILLALIVLAGVLSRGADVPLYASSPAVVGSVIGGSPAEKAGLRAGDRIVSVDGRAMPTWDDLGLEIATRAGRELTLGVVRDGQRLDLPITPSPQGRYEIGTIGIWPDVNPVVMDIRRDSPAEQAGLRASDVVLGVAGEEARGTAHACDGEGGVERFAQCRQQALIAVIKSSADTRLDLRVRRGGDEIVVPVTPKGPAGQALIGATLAAYETRRIDPTVAQALQMSATQNWDNAVLIGRTVRGLFTRDTPVRQLMGPVAIAEMSGTAAHSGWLPLLNLMAMISLNLGLLNLVPVPVLDGGHIAILAVEGLARRDLSIRVKERILMAGAALIVLLMVTAIYNDIARLLR